MEAQSEDVNSRGVAGSLNVIFNQTLQGHEDSVMVVRWNPVHLKAATVDVSGVLIVWKLNEGTWIEDFSTGRQKSAVRDVKWSHDGEKLFMLHEEGEMAMISVAGRRLWSRDTSVKPVSSVFSPDSKLILVVLEIGSIVLYDYLGNFMASISDFGPMVKLNTGLIVKVRWYQGDNDEDDRHLAMLFQKNKLIFLRHERDTDPIVVQVAMKISCMEWNNAGTAIAVGGKMEMNETGADALILSIYNTKGQHLRSLNFSGTSLHDISWQQHDLRLALSVDSFIYIATCRADYKSTYSTKGNSEGTIIYFRPVPNRKTSGSLYFWNLRVNEIYQRTVNNLAILTSEGEFCLFVSSNKTNKGKKNTSAFICDSIGTTLWTKVLDFMPQKAVINREKAIFLNEDGYHVHIWSFRSSGKNVFLNSGKDYVFNVDFLRLGTVAPIIEWPSPAVLQQSGNGIATLTLKDNIMLLARQDGMINQISCRDLFHLADHYYFRDQRYPSATFIALNSDCTKFSVIDTAGICRIARLDAFTIAKQIGNVSSMAKKSEANSSVIPFELKDTWDFLWSEDDPEMFVVMEKTRLFLYRGFEPEEPVQTSGYLHRLRQSDVALIHLDELLPVEFPELSHIQIVNSSIISAARKLIERDLKDSFDFLMRKPEPNGWNLLAETALAKEEYELSMKSYAQTKNYSAMKFLQRLLSIEDRRKRKAEALVWLGKLEDAEKQYLDMDRKDLAIEMWSRNGKFDRVQNLIESTPNKHVTAAMEHDLAHYFYALQDYESALRHLETSKELIEVCGVISDLDKLAHLVNTSEVDDGDGVVDSAVRLLNQTGMAKSTLGYFLKTSIFICLILFLNLGS